MRKKLLSLALALVMCLGLAVPAMAAYEDFVIENGVLTKYVGPGGDVVIPDGVTEIGRSVGSGNTSITSLVIPDSVTKIGGNAFKGCTNLSSLTLGNGITEIGTYAFGSIAITSLTVPASVTKMGDTFSYCPNLASVVIPDTDHVIRVDRAFSHCPSLTSITLGNNVNQFGPSADEYPSLTTLVVRGENTKLAMGGAPSGLTVYDPTGGAARWLDRTRTDINYVNGLPSDTPAPAPAPDPTPAPVPEEQGTVIPLVTAKDPDERLVISEVNYYEDVTVTLQNSDGYPSTYDVRLYHIPSTATLTYYYLSSGAWSLSSEAYNKGMMYSGTEGYLWKILESDRGGHFIVPKNQFSIEIPVSQYAYAQYDLIVFGNNPAYTDGKDAVFFVVDDAPSTPPPTTSAPDASFTDVAADAYYAAPVAWAVEKGITTGATPTSFEPATTCTNAQIITFLWRAYGRPEPTIANPFTNPIQEPYEKAAVWAYEKGMVSGTTFDENIPCTRAMTVTYMWQAAGSPLPSAAASFTDVPADAPCALAVAWAVEKEITKGTNPEGTMFSPDEICDRGQIVTFLHRNLGKV